MRHHLPIPQLAHLTVTGMRLVCGGQVDEMGAAKITEHWEVSESLQRLRHAHIVDEGDQNHPHAKPNLLSKMSAKTFLFSGCFTDSGLAVG